MRDPTRKHVQRARLAGHHPWLRLERSVRRSPGHAILHPRLRRQSARALAVRAGLDLPGRSEEGRAAGRDLQRAVLAAGGERERSRGECRRCWAGLGAGGRGEGEEEEQEERGCE